MSRAYIRRTITFLVLIPKLNLRSLNFLRHVMTELLQHYGLKLWRSHFCSLCPTGHRATNLILNIVKSKLLSGKEAYFNSYTHFGFIQIINRNSHFQGLIPQPPVLQFTPFEKIELENSTVLATAIFPKFSYFGTALESCYTVTSLFCSVIFVMWAGLVTEALKRHSTRINSVVWSRFAGLNQIQNFHMAKIHLQMKRTTR